VAASFRGAEAGRWAADAEGWAVQAEAAANPMPVARKVAPAASEKRVLMRPVLESGKNPDICLVSEDRADAHAVLRW